MDRLQALLNGLTGNLIAAGFVAVYLYRTMNGLEIEAQFAATTVGIVGVYFVGRAAPSVLHSITATAPAAEPAVPAVPATRHEEPLPDLLELARETMSTRQAREARNQGNI